MQVCLLARPGERKKIMAKKKKTNSPKTILYETHFIYSLYGSTNNKILILKTINKIMNSKPFSLFASTDNKIKKNRQGNYTKSLKKKVKRVARCLN